MSETTKTLSEAIAEMLLKHPDWEVRITRHEVDGNGKPKIPVVGDQPIRWRLRAADWNNFGYIDTIITEEARQDAAEELFASTVLRSQLKLESEGVKLEERFGRRQHDHVELDMEKVENV